MKREKSSPKRGTRSLRTGRFSEPRRIYHVTTSTHDRSRIFNELFAGRVVVNAMRREDAAKHVDTLAFVVMPDHLHWLFRLNGSRTLSSTVGTMKSYSTRHLNAVLKRRGRIWQPGFYDHAIRSDEVLVHVARYIVANPLRAKIVNSIQQYSLWDCVWVK